MNHNFFIVVITFLAISIINSGCSRLMEEEGYIRNRSNEYQKAETSPRIQLPDDYDDSAIQDIMPIPGIANPNENTKISEKKYDVPPPQSLLTEADSDGISIQYANKNRWILIDAPKNQVWPYIKSFWELHGIGVYSEDASYGELETNWVALNELNEALKKKLLGRVFDRDINQSTYDKFKVNLRYGVRKGSTEVHLLQISSMEKNDPVWPKQSENLSLEAAILNELLVHIARNAKANTSSSLLAEDSSVPTQDRAQLIADGNGNPILRLNLEFARAFSGIGQALDSAQFTIIEASEPFSSYTIEYILDESGYIELPDKNKEKGFFEKLFGSKDDKMSKNLGDQLVIKLSKISSGVDVTVQIDNDTLASPEIAEQVLSIIKDYLI